MGGYKIALSSKWIPAPKKILDAPLDNVVNLQVPAGEGSVWLAISAKACTKDNLRQKHQENLMKMMMQSPLPWMN